MFGYPSGHVKAIYHTLGWATGHPWTGLLRLSDEEPERENAPTDPIDRILAGQTIPMPHSPPQTYVYKLKSNASLFVERIFGLLARFVRRHQSWMTSCPYPYG